jgi:transcriptional regulator with XRE-family HTH domain
LWRFAGRNEIGSVRFFCYLRENFYTMSIGKRIKKLRELRNYTQTYMSLELEISVSAYSKIERDETEISLKRLEQIAEILNISVNGIMQFDEQVLFENVKSNVNSIKVSSKDDPLVDQLRSEIEFLRQLLNHQNTSKNG